MLSRKVRKVSVSLGGCKKNLSPSHGRQLKEHTELKILECE